MPPPTSDHNHSTHKIPNTTIKKTVTSLLKWKKNQLSDQDSLISDQDSPVSDQDSCHPVSDNHIYLLVTLKKTPNESFTKNPFKIILPHSLLPSPESRRSCLIFDDRPKGPKPMSHKLTFDFVDQKIQSLGIPISKILKFSSLKSGFKTFDSKVDFFESFDVFLVDQRVGPMLKEVLGKVFYGKRKKVPVAVDLRRDGDWREEIENGFRSSLLWLSKGTCSVVKVGKFGGMGVDEIVENVAAAVDGVADVVPKKWGGVKAFHLKFFDSLALAVYQADQKDGGVVAK